jgi:hypothetical protein
MIIAMNQRALYEEVNAAREMLMFFEPNTVRDAVLFLKENDAEQFMALMGRIARSHNAEFHALREEVKSYFPQEVDSERG